MTNWKWLRVLSDIVVLVTLIITEVGLFAAELTGRVVKRGFFCDDESIRLPLKQSTVPSWALVIAAPGIPITALVFGNMYERYIHKRLETSTHYAICCRPSAWVVRLGYEVRWYLIGLVLTLVVTDTAKISVGRLRPNFIEACDPDFSAINCTDEYGFPLYVTSYTCRGDEGDVNEARLSWPSGHASVSAYAFTFVALYVIALRAFYPPRSALRLLLVFISLILALLTTVSRLTDNKHHPSDLLSGSVVGAAIAGTIVYYNLYFFGNFKEKNLEVSMPVASYRLQEMTSIDRPPSLDDENV